MKINIAICEDKQVENEYLSMILKKWSKLKKININIISFNSAESFLFHYEDNKFFDIILLDIQMGELSGIDLAKKLRTEKNEAQIIFITGYPDFMAAGYDVSALHYLIKPVKEDKLFEVLDKAIMKIRSEPRTIIFPKTGGNIKIKANDILYAEVFSHTTTLYLKNGSKEEFHIRISDMEKLMGEGFFRCHRSYIVSMQYVCRVTKSAMIFEDGRNIPLSRNLYDAANQAFIKYN